MFQVEIDGQVLGEGIGSTWDEAKMQVFPCYYELYIFNTLRVSSYYLLIFYLITWTKISLGCWESSWKPEINAWSVSSETSGFPEVCHFACYHLFSLYDALDTSIGLVLDGFGAWLLGPSTPHVAPLILFWLLQPKDFIIHLLISVKLLFFCFLKWTSDLWWRSLQGMSSKRLKQEFPRVLQRVPSSGRFSKNAPPVPWKSSEFFQVLRHLYHTAQTE